jgi:hypothetical protein
VGGRGRASVSMCFEARNAEEQLVLRQDNRAGMVVGGGGGGSGRLPGATLQMRPINNSLCCGTGSTFLQDTWKGGDKAAAKVSITMLTNQMQTGT